MSPPSLAGQSFPYWSHRTQANYFQNAAPSIFFRNYSLVVGNLGCDALTSSGVSYTTAQVSGKIVVMVSHERDSQCTVQGAQANFKPFNPAGLIYRPRLGMSRAWGASNPYQPASNDIPVWYTGVTPGIPIAISGSTAPNINGGNGLRTPNATIFLDMPYINYYELELLCPAGYPWNYGLGNATYVACPLQSGTYFAFFISLFLLCLSTAKLAQFVQAEGKIHFSISQMVLSACWLAGLFYFITRCVFGGDVNLFAIVPYDSFEGMADIPFAFMFTAVLVMGFYFGEMSRLTSRHTVPGLSALKIPAIVFIIFVWAIFIADNLVNALDPLAIDVKTDSTTLYNFFFIWMAVIVPLVCSAILIWGMISIILALSSSPNKGSLVRIMILCGFAICFIWAFGVVHWLNNYQPFGYLTVRGGFNDLWEIPFYAVRMWMGNFYCCGTCILLCFCFSVTVSKEIEISKSGTSSTSSANSSSKSSKSSSGSSSSDPVIEL